jgi:general L-amino acid transport system substrate-binding protein
VADDATGLAANRMTAGSDPAEYSILPERPIKEALYPAVRKGDEAWFDVIRWVVNATIAAEELGISFANVDTERSSADPAIRRFLGLDASVGNGLGLEPGWTYRIVKTVGNYGEIYDRNIGMGSPLKLERGLNRLWDQGGVMWSPPFE